jgi:hypothetical protein
VVAGTTKVFPFKAERQDRDRAQLVIQGTSKAEEEYSTIKGKSILAISRPDDAVSVTRVRSSLETSGRKGPIKAAAPEVAGTGTITILRSWSGYRKTGMRGSQGIKVT